MNTLWNVLGEFFNELRNILIPRHVIVTPMVHYVRFRTPLFKNIGKRWILFWRKNRPERILEQEEAEDLEPGVHFYWALMTDMEHQVVNRQAIPLKPQTVVTQDGIETTAQGLIVYRIKDAKTVVVKTYSPDETIGEIALKAAPVVAAHFDYETIRKSMLQVVDKEDMNQFIKKLEKGNQMEPTQVTRLLTAITRNCLAQYGVEVEYYNFIQFTKTRSFRLFTDSANQQITPTTINVP